MIVAALVGGAGVKLTKPDFDPAATHIPRARFDRVVAPPDVRHVADWVVGSGDNHAMPFIIVDKQDARIFLFGKDGRIRGAETVLLGLTRGDDIRPTPGERVAAQLPPGERVTPAGRFVGTMGIDSDGKRILWVDYDDDIAMHPVMTANPQERRLERLATPSPSDNRISYGCINVPDTFFQNVVMRLFGSGNGVVYILPETRAIEAVIPHYRAPRDTTA